MKYRAVPSGAALVILWNYGFYIHGSYEADRRMVSSYHGVRIVRNPIGVRSIAKSISVVTITPEKAAELLGNNTRNFRKLSEHHARAFSDVMRRGHFKFNGVSVVSIREDGTVRDVQTRLRACQLSGIPFKTIFYEGPVEAEEDIDTGSKRTAGQVLSAQGITNANSTAAAVKTWRGSGANPEPFPVLGETRPEDTDAATAGSIAHEKPASRAG